MTHGILLDNLITPLIAYTLVAASPGPATMSIMFTSMNQGRTQGLAMACGVVTGSSFWGIAAAGGISAFLNRHPRYVLTLTAIAALYFAWIALKAWRVALHRKAAQPAVLVRSTKAWPHSFLHGLGIQMLNPQGILGWLSVILLGATVGSVPSNSFFTVLTCVAIGSFIYSAYAIAFSTSSMINAYARTKQPISVAMALVFSIAALKFLSILFW